MALLEVRDLRTEFATREGVVRAVDGVSLDLDRGRTLCLVGESGCGKSVTALSIIGLLPRPPARIAGGSVRFDGRELTTLGGRELEDVRGRHNAMIFQDPMTSLNPTLTLGTQLTEALRRHLGMGKREALARAADLLDEVGIPSPRSRLDDYPHRLSGGMRQRVMIASAIACEPELLIADEPTTALDVTVQAQVLDLLDDLRAQHRMALLLITHDMGVVAECADDVAVMYAGQIVEQAPVDELFAAPEHPYTEALLGALPQLGDGNVRNGRLTAIPGRPPALVDPPETCRFAARCPYAGLDGCATHMPELREVRPGHLVRTDHPACERARALAREGAPA
jgi:oligopeptide/dipeptide ABC transporter ATP-binding protein